MGATEHGMANDIGAALTVAGLITGCVDRPYRAGGLGRSDPAHGMAACVCKRDDR